MLEKDIMRFKEFSLSQSRCAMRIGTDGVLLGAWAGGENSSKEMQILDVGTGSGLIAIMLAQRYSSAQISSIDIEEGAVRDARENMQRSPYSARLSVSCQDFHTFSQENKDKKWDLIVSNPPFFEPSIAITDRARSLARYTDTLSSVGLLEQASRMLEPNGILSMITPFDQLEELRLKAVLSNMQAHRLVELVTVEGKRPKRLLSEWIRRDDKAPFCSMTQLVIKGLSGDYSLEYKNLLRPFYLFLD